MPKPINVLRSAGCSTKAPSWSKVLPLDEYKEDHLPGAISLR